VALNVSYTIFGENAIGLCLKSNYSIEPGDEGYTARVYVPNRMGRIVEANFWVILNNIYITFILTRVIPVNTTFRVSPVKLNVAW
jgi:hypothetical protein